MKLIHTQHIIKKGLLLISTLFFLLPAAQASHIVGGDITYKHIDGTTYEVLVRVYRDCFYGAPNALFDDPASVGIFDQDNNLVDELEIPQMGDDTLSAVFTDPCLFVPVDVCVHTTAYRDTVTLAPLDAGESYTFVYQRCCRNQTITNIAEPEETGASYTVTLTDEVMAMNNTAPDFGQPAPIFICLGEDINYDHSAIEPDGDELVYSFCSPLVGANFFVPKPQPPFEPPYDQVNFVDGFDLNNLLGGPTPMTINPTTGLISGIPTIQGQFVVGVCVSEYRDGELISTIRRDFQYNVGECLQIESVVAAPEAQCEDLTVSFTNNSTQAENFLWYFDYPNDLSLSSTETSPVFTYPDTGSYTIRLISEPNLPCSDTLDFEVFLQNNSLTAEFDVLNYDCDNQSFLQIRDLSDDIISPIISHEWLLTYNDETLNSTEQNPLFELPSNISGTIELTVTSQNGCVTTSSQTFVTGQNNPIGIITPNHEICAGESIELNPDYDQELEFTYTWTPSQGLDDNMIPNPTASPAQTLSYAVTASALNGECISEGEVEVEVTQLPELDFDFFVDCDALTVQFTNQSQNANEVRWDFGDNGSTSSEYSPSYTFSDYGTYTISLASAENELCKDTITQQITLEPRSLVADFTFEYTDCSQENITAQFTSTSLNSLNNTASYTWTFSNGTTSNQQNPIVVIEEEQLLTASLTITTDEGCTATTSQQDLNIDITELNLLSSNVQICLGTEVGLNPNGNPNYQYQWSPSEGLDNANAVNPIASPNASTIYNVTVTNISADTCSIISQVSTLVPPAINLSVSEDISTCEDEATISANTTIASTLNWTGGSISSSQNEVTVPVSGSTTYTVTAVDALGCTETAEVSVTGGAVSIDAVGGAIICDDESLNISVINNDANDNLSYQWTPAENIISGSNTANPTVSNAPGIYTYTVNAVSQFDCEASETVEAVIYDTDAQFAFDYTIECSGGTVNFINNSQNAFGYAWDFGVEGTDTDVSNAENPTYTYSEAGSYNVTLGTVYDVDCVTPLVIQVNIPEVLLIPNFSFSYTECETDEISVQFTDLTENFLNNTESYSWTFSNGTSSDAQNPIVVLSEEQELTATLTVTTTDNCEATYTQTLNVDFIEENTIGETTICFGDNTELNPNGDESYTYNWTPTEGLSATNIANPTANPTETTIYTVTIQNVSADACSVTRTVTVNVTDEIAISATEDTETCGETITISASSAAENIDFVWTDENEDSFPGASIDVLPTTQMTYIVTASNDFGCTEQDTTTVFNRNMDLSTQGTRIICPTESLVIEAFNNDLGDVVDWQWEADENGSIISGANTPEATVAVDVQGVEVQFYITATNQYNCSAVDSVTVIMSEFNPTFDAQVPICEGIATPINPNADTEYVYEWSPAIGLDNPNSPNPSATLNENQTYTVTITDFQGIDTCFTVETVEVIVNPDINLVAEGAVNLCTEETVNISASADTETTFVWSENPDFSNPFDEGAVVAVSPVGTVTYYVQATDELGCIETSEVTLNSYPLDYELPLSQILCFGETGIIQFINNAANQTLSYDWTPIEAIVDGANTATPTINPEVSTTFYVEIENQIGCTTNDSISIIVENIEEGLFASADPDTILLGSGETSQLLTLNDEQYKYEWQPSNSLDDNLIHNPIASPDETTLYTVSVTGQLGCTTERSVEVVVIDRSCDEPFIFVPSGFTPNNDGENDVLYVRGSNIDETFFTVYNRWGEKIFETDDKDNGWDGTYKGEPLPPDVYGYYLKLKCFNGMEYFKKGNVSLIR